MRKVALLPLIAFVCSYASAEQVEQQPCSKLPTAAERIVCYDRQFPPDQAPATSDGAVEPSASIADIPVQPVESVAASATATGASSTPPSTDQDKTWLRGVFDKPATVSESSRIKEMHRRDTQNMAFLLENDQVWLQDSPRNLPFHIGDTVTIENGTFGGYFLTSDNGTKTRVRRIK